MEQADKPLFVIENNPVVSWPVIVKIPMAGGEYAEHQFNVSMKVLSPDEYEQLFKDAPGAVKGDGAEIPKLSEVVKQNLPIFLDLITDWDGPIDTAGNKVAFTPDMFSAQITGPRGPALSVGIWRAINEVRYGARLGN